MKILANDGISKAGAEAIKESGFELIESNVAQEQLIDFINQNDIKVLLVRSATTARKDLIDACPGLKIIGRGGVGMDNIDVEYAKAKGVFVINTPASSSLSVAELVFAHIFTLVRHLHDSNRKMPLEGDTNFKALKKVYEKATELYGKTMGVIGFGRIGHETVKMALRLGLNVVVYDPMIKEKEVELDFFDGQKMSFNIKTIGFDDLLAQSDFVSLHVPSQKEYVIGEAQLAKMKKTAFIINASRGGVVDEFALVKALDNNTIAGAALDVFESEPKPEITILMNPKISLTPHIGGSTAEAQDRIGVELADQIAELYKTEFI